MDLYNLVSSASSPDIRLMNIYGPLLDEKKTLLKELSRYLVQRDLFVKI